MILFQVVSAVLFWLTLAVNENCLIKVIQMNDLAKEKPVL